LCSSKLMRRLPDSLSLIPSIFGMEVRCHSVTRKPSTRLKRPIIIAAIRACYSLPAAAITAAALGSMRMAKTTKCKLAST